MKEIGKAYIPSEIEEKWYKYWEEGGFFIPSDNKEKECYCIVIPPPNVTGSLHMGHALNATLQDILCRWKRMQGFRTLWVPGTDHAGIATQNVVERSLAKEGINRYELGRDEFIKRVWQWKAEYGNRIIFQLKKLGASCDWTKVRFTMDEGLSHAVKVVFVRLFEEGLIYRDNRLINWCPRCHTALSDLEAEHEELEGKLYYLKYPFEDGSGFVIVATTRPETMLGDTAVAVNPQDDRYNQYIGRFVLLPLTDRKIPIISDKEVDMEFGTGAVKVTPAHDFNDEQIAKRHGLNSVKVIDEDGKMTQLAGKRYQGLDRYECRKLVLKDLKEKGLLDGEKKHKHNVAHCYRCKTIIEPMQTVQWYVNVGPLAEEAVRVVKTGEIKFIPEQWENNYFAWMRDIKDWCISRQIWWGHQIPVWYCPDCKDTDNSSQGDKIIHTLYNPIKIKNQERWHATYNELRKHGLSHDDIIKQSRSIKIPKDIKAICSMNEVKSCPNCSSNNLIRDPDVLDTWFSSALWPFSTLGWPEQTDLLKDYYPTTVLVTAFDIIFFWVARMIMMGCKFMKQPPFRDVYIHAIIRDAKGQKMSKSMGNVIDPLIMIEKYGADAFRFCLAVFAAQGRDIRFSEERLEGYRHFINKIWNAAKFITTYKKYCKSCKVEDIQSLANKWIITRLSATSEDVDKALRSYRFNDAANAIYQFVWHEFCDWYIELIKPDLYSGSDAIKTETVNCFGYVFEKILLLLHPFMPFVTEELWQNFFGHQNTIMLTAFPTSAMRFVNSEKEMGYIIDAISGIRSIRGELNIPLSHEIKVFIKTLNQQSKEVLKNHIESVKKVARCSDVIVGEDIKREKGSAVTVKESMEIYIPLEGLIDVKAELQRLNKEIDKIHKEIEVINKKLSNEDFLKKAASDVVDKEKKRFEDYSHRKNKIHEQIDLLRSIDKK
ncbi:MAG: valine--tRNA ligase [Thermodesulfovibrionales bacterium]|nr:valine--tRNA ligase [Thermodesulfovibrionales bacterium]